MFECGVWATRKLETLSILGGSTLAALGYPVFLGRHVPQAAMLIERYSSQEVQQEPACKKFSYTKQQAEIWYSRAP